MKIFAFWFSTLLFECRRSCVLFVLTLLQAVKTSNISIISVNVCGWGASSFAVNMTAITTCPVTQIQCDSIILMCQCRSAGKWGHLLIFSWDDMINDPTCSVFPVPLVFLVYLFFLFIRLFPSLQSEIAPTVKQRHKMNCSTKQKSLGFYCSVITVLYNSLQ